MKTNEEFELSKFLANSRNSAPQLLFSRFFEDKPIYSVYSIYPDGSGFVIVSQLPNTSQIIGYSFDGHLTEKDIYENNELKTFFKEFDEGIYEASSSIDNDVENNTRLDNSSYLLNTSWGQDSPYNKHTPTDTLIGCVATATAQIMRYYKHPEFGFGTLPSYTSQTSNIIIPEIDIDGYKYSWHMMPQTISLEDDEAIVESVSSLSYHVAVGLKMDFRPAGSASFTEDVIKLLSTHFSYRSASKYVSFKDSIDSYLYSDISNILKFEIENGRPVLVAGNGHAFIADGVSELNKDYYHFNFGFNGVGDGFYHISKPYNWLIKSLIFNLHPNNDDCLRLNSPINSIVDIDLDHVMRGDQFSIEAYVTNISNDDILVSACITTQSGAFLHRISEAVVIKNNTSNEKTTFEVCIPDTVSFSPRKIQLVWLNGNHWQRVEALEDETETSLNIILTPPSNPGFVLPNQPSDILKQEIDTPFQYTSYVISNDDAINNVICILAICDEHQNIITQIGESEAIDLLPGVHTSITINCKISGLAVNTQVQASLFLQVANETILIEPGSNDISNTVNIIPISIIGFRNDIILTKLSGIPESRALSWDKPFIVNMGFYTKNFNGRPEPVNGISIILVDEERIITMLSYESLSFRDNEQYLVDINVNIPRRLKKGNYSLFITFRGLDNSYVHEVLSTDNEIENPILISVEPANLMPFVSLFESLCFPEKVFVGDKIKTELNLYFKSDTHDNDLIFLYNCYLLLVADGIEHTISNVNGLGIINGNKFTYEVECDFAGIAPGEYNLFLFVEDYYHPELKTIVSGEDESITSTLKIEVS